MAENADGIITIALKLKQDEFNSSISGMSNNTSSFITKIKNAFTGATGAAETFGDRVKATFAGMVLTNVATAAWNTITGSIEKATNRLDAMAKATKVIGLITGDSQKAAQVVEELGEAVTNTAYGLDTASTSVQKLTSSGMNVDKATTMVETMMDAIAVYGDGTNATLENVGDALAKITSSGKVQADQWQRLSDAGIPVLKLLSEQLGMTQAEVAEALSKGKISAEQFTTALQTALSQGTASLASVSGQAKEMSGSFAASMDNMKARVAIGVANIIQSFNTWLSDNSLPSIQSSIANSGTAIKLALNGIANAIPGVLSNFGALIPFIRQASEAFDQLAGGQITVGEFLQTLSGMGPRVADALRVIALEALNAGTEFIKNLSLGLAQNAPQIVAAAVDVGSRFVQGLQQGVPALVNAGMTLIHNLVVGFVQGFPQLTNSAAGLIADLVIIWASSLGQVASVGADIVLTIAQGIGQMLPTLADKAAGLMSQLGQTIQQQIPAIAEKATYVIQSFADNLSIAVPRLIKGGFEMLEGLVRGIIDALPNLIATVPKIITTFANIINQNMPIILAKGAALLWELIKGIISVIPDLIAAVPRIVEAIVAVISAYNWLNLGKNIMTFFKDGITGMASAIKGGVKNIAENIVDIIKELPTRMLALGKNIVQGLLNGIKSAWGNLTGWLKEGAVGLIGSAASALGIHSPSTKFRDLIGKFIPPGIIEGVKAAMPKALSALEGYAGDLLGVFDLRSLQDRVGFEEAFRRSGGGQPGEGGGRGYVVNQTINSAKELSPSEIAQETKNMLRRVAWQ